MEIFMRSYATGSEQKFTGSRLIQEEINNSNKRFY